MLPNCRNIPIALIDPGSGGFECDGLFPTVIAESLRVQCTDATIGSDALRLKSGAKPRVGAFGSGVLFRRHNRRAGRKRKLCSHSIRPTPSGLRSPVTFETSEQCAERRARFRERPWLAGNLVDDTTATPATPGAAGCSHAEQMVLIIACDRAGARPRSIRT